MKRILSKFLLASIICSTSSFAMEKDKAKHFGFSGLFGYAAETFIHSDNLFNDIEKVLIGTAVGSVPGLIKEATDSKFDEKDMTYNVAGAFTGSLLSNYLNNNLFITFEHNSKRKSNKVLVSFKH